MIAVRLFTGPWCGEGQEVTALAPVESGATSFTVLATPPGLPCWTHSPSSPFLLSAAFLLPSSLASCLFPKTCLWHSGSNRLLVLQHECAF